ncbi:MAG: hypothetical protein A2261_03205 [Candidatus Magasanikbacteria bacterium RIFOXYA2_FULL_44_8]|uniref:Putative pre-16S rRNA nuclease n=1 Tax=Candidatus Magasanikbacteria bacterium RIFOXYA2_FULL_44_8 TaxID=1798696 RepID=A0A1F6NL78_9BACT|nr:MAG: hypothetical protein A2261_03205 [Candidatus Magasanikbacteria bacterium RIFOXYA2_FULL_44_8]
MNILAIDFGTKNIGLAWCDTGIGAVLPYGQLDAKKWKIELVKLVKEERIERVVIGMPTGVGGSGEKNIERVQNFAAELKALIDLPIEFFDERFSSQQADRTPGGVSRDEKSAMIILEGYLVANKRKSN